MAQIDSLSLKITASSADASKKLKELSDALKVFRSSSNITTATNNLSKLSTALTSLNRLRVMPEKYRQIGEGIENINSSISHISLASVNRVERLAAALEKLGKVRGINASVRKALGDLALPSEEAQNSEEIVKKTENVEDVANRASTAFSRFKSELKGIKNHAAIAGLNSLKLNFDGLKTAIHRALSPLKHFLSSIGRIALYRAIRSAIKSVSAGIKEGLQNLAMFSYQMKELDTHKANKVLSLYTSNFLYLKNAIATAVIPVLKMLEPIIDSVINRMVDFINIIAQLGSFLSGSTTYTRAKYYYKDYAESLDKASGSAAKLNKQLAKFDEINNITFKEGSGSGNNIDDYLQMFEDPIPIADWIQSLKNKDWYEIGKTIADKFSESLENINWDNVKSKASNIATKFASFLNGVFTPRTFKNVAKTIAQSLNTALLTVKVFGENFDAKQLGNGIIKGITTFFETFDFGLLADTLNVFKDKFFDFIKGIFDGLKESDWKKIFSNMFEFFKHIEPDTVGLVLGAILVTKGSKFAITYGAGFIEGIAKAIGTKLATTEISASLGNVVLTAATCLITVAAVTIAAEKISTHALGYDPFDAKGLSAGKDNRNWNATRRKTYYNTGSKAGMPSNAKRNRTTPDRLKNTVRKSAAMTKEDVLQWTKNLNEYEVAGIKVGKVMANGLIIGLKYVNISNKIKSWHDENIKPWFTEEKWISVFENVYKAAYKKTTETIDFTKYLIRLWIAETISWFTYEKWASVADNVKRSFVDKYTQMKTDLGTIIVGILTTAQQVLSYAAFLVIGTNIAKGIKEPFAKALTTMSEMFGKLVKIVSAGITVKFKADATDVINTAKSLTNTAIDIMANLHLNTSALNNVEIDAHTKGGGEVVTSVPDTGNNGWVNPNTRDTVTSTFKNTDDVNTASGFRTASDSVKEAAAKASLPEEVRKKIYGYATGGFPKVGSLFVAHERGPELVGSFEGKTGVANQGQITEAMYDATYKAMSKALSENSTTGRIEVDENAFFRFIQQKANEYFDSTGNKPFPA